MIIKFLTDQFDKVSKYFVDRVHHHYFIGLVFGEIQAGSMIFHFFRRII